MEGLGVMIQLSGHLAHGVTPVGLETRAWGVGSTGGPCGLGKGWQRSRLTSVPKALSSGSTDCLSAPLTPLVQINSFVTLQSGPLDTGSNLEVT